jgi:glycosyltransferase involved in cell wall biosynthesis
MFQPRLRKVLLKRVLDATLYRNVARGAAAVVVASELERDDVVALGVSPDKVRVRGNGFPVPRARNANGDLRLQLGVPAKAQIVLYVGRIAAGKGIEHLLEAVRQIQEAHLVIAGPDDRHGTTDLIRAAQASESTAGRVHTLPVSDEPPEELYPQADVFVLPSAGESFGIVAAEAAAAGTPVIVSDRCGVAGFFEAGEALVVPYDGEAVVDAVRRVLSDADLRDRLSRGGIAAARRTSWDRVTDLQEQIYRDVASRTAVTKLSTDGS